MDFKGVGTLMALTFMSQAAREHQWWFRPSVWNKLRLFHLASELAPACRSTLNRRLAWLFLHRSPYLHLSLGDDLFQSFPELHFNVLCLTVLNGVAYSFLKYAEQRNRDLVRQLTEWSTMVSKVNLNVVCF